MSLRVKGKITREKRKQELKIKKLKIFNTDQQGVLCKRRSHSKVV